MSLSCMLNHCAAKQCKKGHDSLVMMLVHEYLYSCPKSNLIFCCFPLVSSSGVEPGRTKPVIRLTFFIASRIGCAQQTSVVEVNANPTSSCLGMIGHYWHCGHAVKFKSGPDRQPIEPAGPQIKPAHQKAWVLEKSMSCLCVTKGAWENHHRKASDSLCSNLHVTSKALATNTRHPITSAHVGGWKT